MERQTAPLDLTLSMTLKDRIPFLSRPTSLTIYYVWTNRFIQMQLLVHKRIGC